MHSLQSGRQPFLNNFTTAGFRCAFVVQILSKPGVGVCSCVWFASYSGDCVDVNECMNLSSWNTRHRLSMKWQCSCNQISATQGPGSCQCNACASGLYQTVPKQFAGLLPGRRRISSSMRTEGNATTCVNENLSVCSSISVRIAHEQIVCGVVHGC